MVPHLSKKTRGDFDPGQMPAGTVESMGALQQQSPGLTFIGSTLDPACAPFLVMFLSQIRVVADFNGAASSAKVRPEADLSSTALQRPPD